MMPHWSVRCIKTSIKYHCVKALKKFCLSRRSFWKRKWGEGMLLYCHNETRCVLEEIKSIFFRDLNQEWKTSCITQVTSPNTVCTASTEYQLVGPINSVLALEQGKGLLLVCCSLGHNANQRRSKQNAMLFCFLKNGNIGKHFTVKLHA